MELENKILCAKCQGQCCKNSGCEFSTHDFSTISFEELQKYIEQGLISICCDFGFDNNTNLIYFLFVRMRNVGKDAIDFLSIFPAPCHALKSDGCSFSYINRPSDGKYLIPKEDGKCFYIEDVSKNWMPYQNILRQLVIKNTGLTPEEKIRERMEDVFYNFLQTSIYDEQFCYFANFFDKISFLNFKDEFERTFKRCQSEQKLNRKNPFLKM